MYIENEEIIKIVNYQDLDGGLIIFTILNGIFSLISIVIIVLLKRKKYMKK